MIKKVIVKPLALPVAQLVHGELVIDGPHGMLSLAFADASFHCHR